MDLPVIDTPVAPRWVWMEEITYSHIPIATLITAFMLLSPLLEYIGYRRKDPRLDRLAKGFIWFAMILFSPGAALGTGIPVFIIGAYPEFWSRWSNLFFWPLVVQFGFFLMEVFFLFFGYYLPWDRWMNRKPLHITMGVIAATWGYLVQVVWDALGSYMLTPGSAALPGVTQPVGWSAAAFFNPTFPLLLAHRTFGNFSYTMLLVGGVFALRYMSRKRKGDAENADYFRWASNLTFAIGVLTFFAQPFLGWTYAAVLRRQAPVAFAAIMGGHVAWLFTLKMGLILLFLTIGGLYLCARFGGWRIPGALTLGLGSLLGIVYLHPPLNWIASSHAAWYAVSVAAIVGLIAGGWLIRGRISPDWVGWRWAMFAAGLAAFFVFCFGGFIRERAKSPDTVYGQIVKPERTAFEQDRYLTYDKCLRCHQDTPAVLSRYEKRDWSARVQIERRRQGAPPLSDEQAQRIIRFLREEYP